MLEEEEGGTKGLIMADSMQVVSALADQIEHPAGQVIHSVALGHHGNCGCGVTGLVGVACSWSRQVSELRKQGVPLPMIFAIFDDCLQVSKAAIFSLSRPLAELLDEHNSKQLCHGREQAMELAVAAITPQTNTLLQALDLKKVMSLQIVGVASQHSRVEVGVVCQLPWEMVKLVRQSKCSTLRTIVLLGDAIEDFAHRGLKRDVKISSVIRSCDMEPGSHDPWLLSWKQLLKKYSIGLVAVEGTVSRTLYDHCLSEGIIILTHLTPSHTRTLPHITGARAMHYISQITHDADVGLVRVKEIEGGWSKVKVHQKTTTNNDRMIDHNLYCALQPALLERSCDVTTVIICGHTHSQTSILEHSLRNCLSRLRCVISDGCVVQGGGWVEQQIATVVRNTNKRSSVASPTQRVSIPYCMGTGWLGNELETCDKEREMVSEGFAAGLEEFAAVVHHSVRELDSAHIFSKIDPPRSRHGGVGVAKQFGGVVWDACSCKLSALRAALHLTQTLHTSNF